MTFERQKFKDLMHYIIWKAGDSGGFGATKLYKIMWFSDARMYVLEGKSITGAVYTRQKHGPVPKAAMPARSELEKEGRIRIWKDRYYNKPIWRFQSLSDPRTEGFSAKELQTIDWWIQHVDEEHTANSISDLSHDYGWEIAAMGEELPYHAILASRLREPTEEELEWAKTKARERGLV